MLLLAYCAGLRRSELTRLDLGDVDLRCCAITIRETMLQNQDLPLPGPVMAELRRYIDARRRAGAPRTRSPGCSGMTKETVATPRRPSPGCSSTSCAAPSSSRDRGERVRVCTTFATRWS